jgi:hypothetical protein
MQGLGHSNGSYRCDAYSGYGCLLYGHSNNGIGSSCWAIGGSSGIAEVRSAARTSGLALVDLMGCVMKHFQTRHQCGPTHGVEGGSGGGRLQ